MLLRFRTPEGTFRVSLQPTDDFSVALTELSKHLPGFNPQEFLFSDSHAFKGHPVSNYLGQSIAALGLKHGDLLFVTIGHSAQPVEDSTMPSAPSKTKTAQQIFETVKQPVVDDALDKLPGKIPRKRDPRMCRHGEKAMCDYCMPLEPFDANYQEEHNIKHLSFHAYLRKLNIQPSSTGATSNTGSYVPPLTEPDYSVKKPCPTGHPPWPAGICSKCQPSAITLQRQEFRMVDHVEFSTSTIVNSFIESWRQTGAQRIGYLYGHYEQYEAVPLGIKAVVEAIYEPPQQDERDGVTLTVPWDEEEKRVDLVAKHCGLERVGVIFTDLLDDGEGTSNVVCKRHIDSYFLSSLEIFFAAEMQRRHSNPSRWSTEGHFSSKFVTCVISGNSNKEIDIASYQVSASAEAMLKADLIEPSINPSMMRVQEPTNERYVPDVFYTKLNEYKRTIQENAKPAFPVEYLLVTLTHGFPENEKPKFVGEIGKFPIENRGHMALSQDMQALAKQLGIRRGMSSLPQLTLDALSDFHLLCYVNSLGVISEEEQKVLCEYAAGHDENLAAVLRGSPGWETLKMIVAQSI